MEVPCSSLKHCVLVCLRCLACPGTRQAYLAWTETARRYEEAGQVGEAVQARQRADQALVLWRSRDI